MSLRPSRFVWLSKKIYVSVLRSQPNFTLCPTVKGAGWVITFLLKPELLNVYIASVSWINGAINQLFAVISNILGKKKIFLKNQKWNRALSAMKLLKPMSHRIATLDEWWNNNGFRQEVDKRTLHSYRYGCQAAIHVKNRAWSRPILPCPSPHWLHINGL